MGASIDGVKGDTDHDNEWWSYDETLKLVSFHEETPAFAIWPVRPSMTMG